MYVLYIVDQMLFPPFCLLFEMEKKLNGKKMILDGKQNQTGELIPNFINFIMF